MNPFKFAITLLSLISASLYAQSGKSFEDGKLFVKVKSDFAATFLSRNLTKDKAFNTYKISSVSRAFKIDEDPLNRIYLIEFDEITQTDLLLMELESTGLFEYVEKVPVFNYNYTPNDLNSAQWNLKKIMAENAWDVRKGSSKIIIAIVDDAMDTVHPDLEPVVWRNKAEIRGNGIDDDANGYIDDYIGWDAADYDNDPTPGGTVLYHGTHCSGIAGAATNNSKGIASIGFGCRLMIAKIGRPVYDFSQGKWTIGLFNPYKGVEYAIINKANVISMSWGGPASTYSNTYQALFDNAYKKGIVCVAAAANSSTSAKFYPAAYNHVIAVGSTTSSDKISSFSNYGTWVDVMAPGSGIYSTLPNNKYGYLDGTSMACPLVSGLCGLMFCQNPNATPDQIEACLKSGCDNINSINPSYTGLLGAGRINAENSLKCLKSINAAFISDIASTCPGDTIQFFDKTAPTPWALKWKFSGGTPSSSFSSNPKVKYTSVGTYDVELIVFDSTNSDTLLMKNYVTISVPKATLSLNRTIVKGNTTTIRLDFTGKAPYKFTISDGTTASTVSNINYSPYFYSVSPNTTTIYTLTAFSSKKCTGTFSGTSKVTVLTSGINCANSLRYQASFGGSADDMAYGLSEDAARNIYISGNTLNYGNGDGCFTKFNSDGNLVWHKTYGGNANDIFQKHIQTPDNGYLLIGYTASYGVGADDVWVVKTDSSGNVQWSKTIGGSGTDWGWNAAATADNGFLVYGYTNSYGAGDFDNYIIKLDKNGNLKWTKVYGNSSYSSITGLATYPDGSSIFCSNYWPSSNGDPLIAKIDSLGNLIWSKKFGGTFNDGMYALAKGTNDNIYIAGLFRSSATNQEMLIACFTPSGVNKWMKSITGSGNESIYNIENDGDDLIVSGYTNSYGAGASDISLIKFDTSGNILFARAIGGTNDEISRSCLKSADDGYYTVGYTKSYTNGSNDIFINKLSCKPELGCNEKVYTPVVTNLSLSVQNETQATASGGSLSSQSISATTRSIGLTYQCKTSASTNSGSSCLNVNSYSKISSTTTGFSGVLDDGDYFGQAVRRIGDFDGDGIEDFVAGSQYDDDGGSNQGAIYIICLKKDGSIKSKQKISATNGGFTGNLSGNNFFGSSMSILSDLDGDGIRDMAVGQIYDNTGNTRAGAVWILFLNANGTVKSHQKIANGIGGFPSILDTDDNFGIDISDLGDVNGDGTSDIAVGAHLDDDGGTNRGAVYIIYLNSNGTVKSYKKISSISGGFGGTIDDGDGFGYSISNTSDFNNDGIQDIAVGARLDDDGGADRGAVWLLNLDVNENVGSYSKISSTATGFTNTLDNTDQFGSGAEVIGDINNDNINDIAISAPLDDDGATNSGAVWLIHLTSSGGVKSYIKISKTTQAIINKQIDNSDYMGWKVSFLNDIDNDGNIEILTGTMLDDDGGTDRGAVYIFNLGDTCKYNCIETNFQSKVSATQGGFTGTLVNSDNFGNGVNGIGDIDNDGIKDMAVSASGDDDGGSNIGAVWILFMKADGTVRTQQKISATKGGFTGSITNGNYFGGRIVPLGDLNADGVPDIAVSHHFDNTVTTRAGAVWILFLNSNGTVKSSQKITSGVGGFTATLQADDRFGGGLESIGDFDGDGVVDLIAGAQEDKDGGTPKGAFYILYLNTNGTVKSYSKISATQGNFTGTLKSIDRFGFSLTSPGDIDKDGIKDFVIGSRDDADGGPYRGAIWTLFMNANGTVKSHQKNSSVVGNLVGIKDNDQFTWDMRTIDDLDKDGINEIVISAPFDDDGGTDRGAVWIIFLNNSGKIKRQLKISSISSFLSGKLDNSDYFGFGLGVLDDLNGDGYKEILVGANLDDDGGTDKGAVYIFNLKDTCVVPLPKKPVCKLRADFNYKLACLGDTFKFTDVSIDSLKVGIIKWKWVFGDGQSFEGNPKASHVYNTAGTYLVKLIISTNGNSICTDSSTRPVKVSNQLRILGLQDDTICISDSAQLGVGNIICGVQSFTYLWQPATGISNNKILNPKTSPGGTTKYILTITDKNNQKAYDTLIVKVDSNCCRSYAIFVTDRDMKCEKDTFIINNQSQVKLGATYTWKVTSGGNYSTFTGKNPPPLVFNSSGTYTVRLIVNDLCGTDTMSRDIYVVPAPKVDAGRDTSLCNGDSLLIGPVAIGMNQYYWTPSAGLNFRDISQPTAYFSQNVSYILRMTTEVGCIGFDTIQITKIIEPKLNIGPDTSFCTNGTFLLKSNIIAKSYLWNDGSKLPSLQITTAGTYWLEAKDKCMQRDTAVINMKSYPVFSLGNDTFFCKTTSFVLKPNIGIGSLNVKWDNGLTTNTRTVNKSGTYWLTLGNGICDYTDSVNILFSRLPFANLGRDTIICSNTSIKVDATDSIATSYLWNDGDIKPIRQLSAPGRYMVTLSNKCGSYIASINIGNEKPAIPYLGDKLFMCIGDTLVLNATNANTKYYLWDNGSVKPTRSVFLSGKYSIRLGNICGNYDTSVTVEANNCDCDIFVPNTFTPTNSSGINDLFKPVVPLGCEPVYYQLSIYNRWGEILYMTNDYNEGWNGDYKGKRVANGDYTWIITMRYEHVNKGKTFRKTGSVLIIE